MLYNNYVQLCNEARITPSAAAIEMGLSKPTVNRWKKGGGATDATLLVVTKYFTAKLGRQITIAELTGEKEKAPGTDAEGFTDAEIEAVNLLRQLPENERSSYVALLRVRVNQK